MRHQGWFALTSALVAVLLMVLGLFPASEARQTRNPVIALVLDTDIGLNAAVIRQGAHLAAREFKADLNAVAPSGNDAAGRQVDLVREQVNTGASAILMVPVDARALHEAIRLCRERGVAMVVLDACGEYRGQTPYVGTNHRASGMGAAEELLGISGAGRLLVLYSDDSVSLERLQGAKLAAAYAKNDASFQLVETDQPWAMDSSVRALINLIRPSAVLCLSGALTESAAQAIEATGAGDRITLAGFDCDQTRIGYLESGRIRFTVLRRPLAVGYLGFKHAMEMLNEQSPPPVEYTDSSIIMSEDILKPGNAQLVFPLIH